MCVHIPPVRDLMRNKDDRSSFSDLQASALAKDIRLLSSIVGTPGWTVAPYPQLHELDKLKALLANDPTAKIIHPNILH